MDMLQVASAKLTDQEVVDGDGQRLRDLQSELEDSEVPLASQESGTDDNEDFLVGGVLLRSGPEQECSNMQGAECGITEVTQEAREQLLLYHPPAMQREQCWTTTSGRFQ